MTEILIINVTGEDKPGITNAVTSTLAALGASILDIGQAVIHASLSLGLLAEVPDTVDGEQLRQDISDKMQLLGMQVRFETISEQSYQAWVDQQGKSRYIVTLLSRYISADQIARVTAVTASNGLNIDKITRLSGRLPLDQVVTDMSEGSKASVEFSVRGEPENMTVLRQRLLELSSEMEVDVAFQEDNIYRRNRRLVVFDMDSTLIDAEVIDELAKEANVGDQVAEITERAMRGELDFNESFSERVALLKGLDESVLDRVARRIDMTEGSEQLITTLHNLGYKTAILSGGFNYFARRIQNNLGIDYVYANELEAVDGKVTGRVVGQVVDGNRKAQLLREIAEKEGVRLEQVIAVGDGANDLPMLSIAGLGIAFRAKPLVKASAKQSISNLGLDAILYLMGFSDRDVHPG